MLSMSKQSLRRDMGSGQRCSETDSSVCGSGSEALVSHEPVGVLLESKAEEPNMTLGSCASSYFPARLPEVVWETWASNCKWSWPEPDSALTVLHNSHRLYRISSRFCSSPVCSLSRCSFSLVCRDDRNKEEKYCSHGHDWQPRPAGPVGLMAQQSAFGKRTNFLISH